MDYSFAYVIGASLWYLLAYALGCATPALLRRLRRQPPPAPSRVDGFEVANCRQFHHDHAPHRWSVGDLTFHCYGDATPAHIPLGPKRQMPE